MRITRERHVYSLGVSEPVATVTAPCSLTVETCDCFNGQVTEDGQPKARLNFSHVNPATGPIVVEGAEPGDVLRVHIRAIRPEKTGALMTAPGAGALPDRVKGDTRICPIADGHFTFMGVELPPESHDRGHRRGSGWRVCALRHAGRSRRQHGYHRHP